MPSPWDFLDQNLVAAAAAGLNDGSAKPVARGNAWKAVAAMPKPTGEDAGFDKGNGLEAPAADLSKIEPVPLLMDDPSATSGGQSAGPSPHKVRMWQMPKSADKDFTYDEYTYDGPGGTRRKSGVDITPGMQAQAQAILDSGGGTQEPLFDYSKWPKTGGWSRPDGSPPPSADARDFLGAGRGNILSQLTDVDRIRDPFAYDAAMRDLQKIHLGDQQAVDANSARKSQFGDQMKLERERIASEDSRNAATNKTHVESAKIHAAASKPDITPQMKLEAWKASGGDMLKFQGAYEDMQKMFGDQGKSPGDNKPPQDSGPKPKDLAAIRSSIASIIDPASDDGTVRIGDFEPRNLEKVADVINSAMFDPKTGQYDREALSGILEEMKSGKLGNWDKLRQGMAKAMASNYVLSQYPPVGKDSGTSYPWQYSVPVTPGGPDLFRLRHGPSSTGGRIADSAAAMSAYGMPYNQLLFNGEDIPFNSTDVHGLYGDTTGGTSVRHGMSAKRAAGLQSILDLLSESKK